MAGKRRAAFVPVAGLHHARRDCASGFCVLSDIGVVIEMLKRDYGLSRIAYVDIDAHHGDGVLYSFNADPGVFIADIHQQGIFPMTGEADETGLGEAAGSKLNLPLDSGAGDAEFFAAWAQAEAFIRASDPQLVIFQCGVDSLAGDPLTSLNLSTACHAHAAGALMRLAAEHCDGRLLVMGGGGYQLENIAAGWCAVLAAMKAEMVAADANESSL
jgi:acetoin utilization protein AcuC